jgi:hypothetical protein
MAGVARRGGGKGRDFSESTGVKKTLKGHVVQEVTDSRSWESETAISPLR